MVIRTQWALLPVSVAVMSGLLLVLFLSVAGADEDEIDWNRARSLLQKSQRGETLSPEDQAYLDRAREERRKRFAQDPPGKERMGLTPLTEMGEGTYKGEDGGLYGGGRNVPPQAHQEAALKEAGVSRAQVHVVWIKQALARPDRFGAFPEHARRMQADLVTALDRLKERFPNLRIAYLSSRIYAGYAHTPLNPEPYAYETAFTVRWLIQDQIKGDPQLNYDPERGEVTAPLLLWGPYLWGDGLTPRKDDGLVWKQQDLGDDGTHPSTSGRQKVASLLLDFFKTDPSARPWFMAP